MTQQATPFRSNPRTAAAFEKIAAYVEKQPDGATLAWLDVEMATGVSMKPNANPNGRELLRRALRRAKRPYETMHGLGLRLSAVDNAQVIATGSLSRAAQAIRKAGTTHNHLIDRHGAELPAAQRDRLTRSAATIATLQMQAKGGIKALKD